MPLSHSFCLEQTKQSASILEQFNLLLLVGEDAPLSHIFVDFLLDSILEI